MEPTMNFTQAPAGHVSVYFRRADIGVTEKFLDNPQISPMFQQVGGEAMPQHVRRNIAGNSGAPHALLHAEPQSHGSEWRAPFSEEHGPWRPGFNQFWPACFEKALQRGNALSAHRDHAFFVSFPNDIDVAGLKMQLLEP